MFYLIVLVVLVLLLALTPAINQRIRSGITVLIVLDIFLLAMFLVGIDLVHELRR